MKKNTYRIRAEVTRARGAQYFEVKAASKEEAEVTDTGDETVEQI